jgi:hypothetical protein
MIDLAGRKALTLVLAAALVGGLIGSGCGSSAQAVPLTRSEFLKEGNAICKSADQQREEELKKATAEGGSEPSQAEMVIQVALPSVQEMTDELAGLEPPAGDEKEVQAIVTAFEHGAETVESEPTNVPASMSAFTEATRAAEAYGLTSCGI